MKLAKIQKTSDIVEDEADIVSVTGRAVFRDVELSQSIKCPKSLPDAFTAALLLCGTVSLRDPARETCWSLKRKEVLFPGRNAP